MGRSQHVSPKLFFFLGSRWVDLNMYPENFGYRPPWRRQALKSPHIVGLFCPLNWVSLTFVWYFGYRPPWHRQDGDSDERV